MSCKTQEVWEAETWDSDAHQNTSDISRGSFYGCEVNQSVLAAPREVVALSFCPWSRRSSSSLAP